MTLTLDSSRFSGPILITDISPNGDTTISLECGSDEIITNQSVKGDWYLHPTEQSIEEEDRIANSPQSMNDRGWRRTRDRIPGVFTPRRIVRLKRVSDTAVEGVFTCHIPGDIPTPVSVGIYYPSEINFCA